MPQSFSYEAVDTAGRRQRGVVEAENDAAAAALLTARKLEPISLRQTSRQAVRSRSKTRRRSRKRLSPRTVSEFVVELNRLVGSGVPLATGLEIIAAHAGDASSKAFAEALLQRVSSGVSLSHALRDVAGASGALPSHAFALIRAGEASGDLARALSALDSDLKRRNERVGKFRAALAYPLLVFTVSLGLIAAILIVIVPGLERLLTAGGVEPGFEAQLILFLSRLLKDDWQLLLAGLLAAGLVFWRIAQLESVRKAAREAFLRQPGIGPLLRKLETARWCVTVGDLLNAGVPAIEALTIGADVLRTFSLAADARRIARDVEQGAALSQALQTHHGWPPAVARLARIGEETRGLGPMLNNAGEVLQAEADEAIAVIASAIGPASILIVGAIVGTFVAFTFSAIISINDIGLAF